MSIAAQARSRREAAINKRLGPKTGRASTTTRKVRTDIRLLGSTKVSKTARKSMGKK